MSMQIDEFILGALCVAPFVAVGLGLLYLVLAGDPCEEGEE